MRILLVIALLIAYGSLYPGDFSASSAGAFEKFLTDWRGFTSLGDVLGNIALFFPLGVAGVLFAASGRNAAARDARLLLLAFVFAFALQVMQVWLPSRSAALADVVWNMAGMALGIAVGRMMGKRAPEGGRLFHSASLVPLLILVLWLLTELLPLVPSLDWQKFKDALKPLFLEFNFSFPAAMPHAAGAMVAGSALIALGRRPAGWLAGALVLVLVCKLAIVNLTLDASMLAGLLAGYLGCLFLSAGREKKMLDAAFWLLLAAWSIAAITPFSPVSGGNFNGIPFATLLRGSMETSVQGLAQSLFIYTALLWLAQKMGGSLKGSAVGLAIWSSLLELAQMGLLGRTADVTEPLLVLLLGWGISVAQAEPRPQPAIKQNAQGEESPVPARAISRQRWWIAQGLSVFCLAALFWGGLRLPGIPYNLRELFLGDGHFLFLLVFALALLWVGGGAVWAGRKIASSKRPYFSLPAWTLAASFISLILLSASVTQESIDDIAGSNNLYWFVINRNIWGDGWRDFFMLLGPGVVEVFERPLRYAALYSPLPIFLALTLSFLHLHARSALTVRRFLLLVVSALPGLWLAKAVAFDWSSTDNLNELIARDGPMGWGGGGYLYALLGLLCVNAVIFGRALSHRFSRLALVGVLSIAALPLGWWLLNLGLEAKVEKYGFVFSGAQFLLGPDRTHLLSEMNLFARWCALQIGFVVVTGVGIRNALLNPYRAQRS